MVAVGVERVERFTPSYCQDGQAKCLRCCYSSGTKSNKSVDTIMGVQVLCL